MLIHPHKRLGLDRGFERRVETRLAQTRKERLERQEAAEKEKQEGTKLAKAASVAADVEKLRSKKRKPAAA